MIMKKIHDSIVGFHIIEVNPNVAQHNANAAGLNDGSPILSSTMHYNTKGKTHDDN